MRFAALITAALLCGACDGPRPEPAPGAGTPAEELSPAGPNAVAFIAGGDTVATETFEHRGSHIQGEIRDRDSGVRAQYLAELVDEGRIERLEISAFEGDDPTPRYQATLLVRSDTVISEERERGGEAQSQRRTIPPGTRIYLNPSIGLLEHLVFQAASTKSFHVLQLSLDEEPRLAQAEITRSGEHVEITTADSRITLEVDREGRILAGTTGEGNVQVRRIR
jgi:hypothetical protein